MAENKSKESRSELTTQAVADDFDRVAEDYEKQINSAISFAGMEHTFYIDVKRRQLLKLIGDRFTNMSALDVLDLGCGIGGYHGGLASTFHELHGADVSSKSLEMARRKHPWVHYEGYDGARLPYTDDRFDVVFTICVMHHVPPGHWENFVDEMMRVLRPGGMALVFEHNPYNPATQYIVRTCEIDKDAVLLRPFQLRRLFARSGFGEVRTRTILSVPPKGAVLSGLDGLLGYLPFGAQYYLSAVKPS